MLQVCFTALGITDYPLLQVGFAAFNSASSCVLSGEAEAIRAIADELKAEGVKATMLPTAHGFHSADIEPSLPSLLQSATKVLARDAGQPARGGAAGGAGGEARPVIISTLTGEVLTERPPASHWVRHAREPVSLDASVLAAARRCRVTVFLELGVQPHLTAHVVATASGSPDAFSGAEVVVIPTLRKKHDDATQLCEAVARLFVAGVEVGLDRSAAGARQARPPASPLVGTRCWLPDAATRASVTPPAPAHLQLLPKPSAQLLFAPAWSPTHRPLPPVTSAMPSATCIIDLVGDMPASFLAAVQVGKAPFPRLPSQIRQPTLPCLSGEKKPSSQIRQLTFPFLQGTTEHPTVVRDAINLHTYLTLSATAFGKIDLVVFRGDAASLLGVLQTVSEKSVQCARVVAVTLGLMDHAGKGADGSDSGGLSESRSGGGGDALALVADNALRRDAAVWGLVKSARLEVGNRFDLEAINLDSLQSEPTIQLLCSLLAAREVPQQGRAHPSLGSFYVSGGLVLEERLMPAPKPPASPIRKTSAGRGGAARSGVALITGGSGGLALQLARWLVQHRSVRTVVLASRSGKAAGTNGELSIQLARAAAETGASVVTVQADAASREDMRTLIATHSRGLAEEGGGIYHATGVLDDGLLKSQTADRLNAVARPKVRARHPPPSPSPSLQPQS